MAAASIARASGTRKDREQLAAALSRDPLAGAISIEDGRRLLVAAQRNGLLALLGDDWINALPLSISERAAQLLAETRLAQRKVELTWEDAATCLDGAGIRAVTLKGPPLAERLYTGEQLRFSTDVDFLVHSADLDRAAERLVEAGCRRQGKLVLHAAGIPIDLHGGTAPKYGAGLNADAAHGRSIPWQSVRGVASWILEPADELLHLICHVAKHWGGRLDWEEDVRRHRCNLPTVDPETIRQRASEAGLSLSLRLGARQVVRDLGSEEGLEQLAGGRPSPRLLAVEYLARHGIESYWPWSRYPGVVRMLHRALQRESPRESASEMAGWLARKLRKRQARFRASLNRR